MKVLLFFYDLHGAAGIQRVIATLSNALVAQGVEVQVVVASPRADSFFELDPRVSISSLGVPEPHSRSRIVRWASKILWASRVWLRLRRHVVQQRIDHVVDNGTAFGLLYPFKRLAGARFVLFRHFPVRAFPNGGIIYRALQPLKRRAHVVVLTESIARELRELGYTDVTVIPNPLRERAAGTPVAKQPVVLAVGRDSPQKGFDTLLHAFARLRGDGADLSLRIIGAGVPGSPVLTALRDELGLGARVHLEDARPGLDQVIDAAEMVVLPSRYEALPMFLLEAMARGAAIIGTDVDGVRDFVRDGVNGLLVPPESPDTLASAIERLHLDDELRDELASRAPGSVAHLAPHLVAERWMGYLTGLRD